MADYTPRLTSDGMVGNAWYYANNPFYNAGYGLPNCTAYVWGRRGEITGTTPNTSLGNGDSFWGYNLEHNVYPYGQEPKLGAIACFRYSEPYTSRGGHVAIVEVINDDGSIITSNSAYSGEYFYTQRLTQPYKATSYSEFQGFIYLDGEPVPPTPSKSTKLPIYMMLRNSRRYR